MSEDEDRSDNTDTAPPTVPRFADFVAALGALTCLPLARPDPSGEAFARATLFFPLVGVATGALLVGLNRLIATTLPAWGSSVVLVVAWAVLARDWDGTCKEPGEWKMENRERGMENRLTESTLGTGLGAWFSWLATSVRRAPSREPRAPASIFWVWIPLAATWLVKLICLGTAIAARPGALLFAPLLGRWSMVVLAVGARDAAAPGRKFNSRISFREFALTSVATCTIVFTLAQALGILVFVCVGAVVLTLRLLVHHWAEGITWRFLLVSSQGVEVLIVLLFAAL